MVQLDFCFGLVRPPPRVYSTKLTFEPVNLSISRNQNGVHVCRLFLSFVTHFRLPAYRYNRSHTKSIIIPESNTAIHFSPIHAQPPRAQSHATQPHKLRSILQQLDPMWFDLPLYISFSPSVSIQFAMCTCDVFFDSSSPPSSCLLMFYTLGCVHF